MDKGRNYNINIERKIIKEMELSYFLQFFCFSFLTILIFLGSYAYFHHQYIILTQAICDTLDDVILGRNPMQNLDLETQSSKIRSKLDMIVKMAKHSEEQAVLQRQKLQQMISDISHQVKTPISNILMYTDTLELKDSYDKEQQKFLFIIKSQVKKLEFLMQSLVKMSRLESEMFIIKQKRARLFPVISKAVSSVLLDADKKQLRLCVVCPQELSVFFDEKWTEEAITNVLDNAIKYTDSGGKISIYVEAWQLYTRIEIKDTGHGICPEHQNDIFKRFYREKKVHEISGVGLGLYLTREILEKQGGYITVTSYPEKGSCFSIFLPNKNRK